MRRVMRRRQRVRLRTWRREGSLSTIRSWLRWVLLGGFSRSMIFVSFFFFLGGVNFWIGRPPVVISSPVFFVSLVCIAVKVYLHCPIGYYVVTSLFLLFIPPFCVLQFFRIHTTAYRFWIATCYLSLYFNDTIFA